MTKQVNWQEKNQEFPVEITLKGQFTNVGGWT